MAKTKLTSEQRATLLEWLAADYDWRLIRKWFEEREWPTISRALVSYYRNSRDLGIAKLRDKRRNNALKSGLALKEERVARLVAHADALEAIKWVPDKRGRMWNEKAWRETLAEIAAEMGHRKQVVEMRDWRDRVVELLKAGTVTPDDVRAEFGDDLATELFTRAGLPLGASSAPGTSGGEVHR